MCIPFTSEACRELKRKVGLLGKVLVRNVTNLARESYQQSTSRVKSQMDYNITRGTSRDTSSEGRQYVVVTMAIQSALLSQIFIAHFMVG